MEKSETIKLRKLLLTAIMVIVGLALVGLGYWVGQPLGNKSLDFGESLVRSKLNAGANAFGFIILLVAFWINMPPPWINKLRRMK